LAFLDMMMHIGFQQNRGQGEWTCKQTRQTRVVVFDAWIRIYEASRNEVIIDAWALSQLRWFHMF
jgi:hypothetical protein